jgi:hypothetical protein
MRDSRATRGQPPSHQAHLRARRPLRTGKWPHEERAEWTSRRRNAAFMYAPKVPVQRNGLVSTLARPSYTCHKSINSPSYKGGARVRPLLLSQRLSYPKSCLRNRGVRDDGRPSVPASPLRAAYGSRGGLCPPFLRSSAGGMSLCSRCAIFEPGSGSTAHFAIFPTLHYRSR